MPKTSEWYHGDDGISLNRDIKGVLDRVYSGKHAAAAPKPRPKRPLPSARRGLTDSQGLSEHLDALRSLREQSQESSALREQLQELRDELSAVRLLRGQLQEAREDLARYLHPR